MVHRNLSILFEVGATRTEIYLASKEVKCYNVAGHFLKLSSKPFVFKFQFAKGCQVKASYLNAKLYSTNIIGI